MLFRYGRFMRRMRKLRPLFYLLLVILIIDTLHILSSRPRTILDPVSTTSSSSSSSSHKGRSRFDHPSQLAPNTSVFIVSVHRNTADVLLSAWNNAVLSLIDHLGPSNVHFSAIESGSQDGTKAALSSLRDALDRRGVTHTIHLGSTVDEQLQELDTRPLPDAPRASAKGWVWDPHEEHYALRRIPYLAKVRNQAMKPLRDLAKPSDTPGITKRKTFDRVLWINDVVFSLADALTLLNTREGAYAAACSMDFKTPPFYYDTFALRDDRGDKAGSDYWPWFLSPTSRAAVRAGEPTRVQSCWNGMVAFDAAPFYAEPPLAFRGIPDSLADLHLEGSECCLVHADNDLSYTQEGGVWLNPNVRVGYSVEAYDGVHERTKWPGRWVAVKGTWSNRWHRWRSGVLQFALERWTVRKRMTEWIAHAPAGEARKERGEMCLINEMQIMWQNGWKHL